jgi:anti-anti-sigma factor
MEVQAECVDRGAPVVVDMAETTFIDSTGISWLVHLQRRMTVGGSVTVVASRPVQRALSVTGVDQLISVVPARGSEPSRH